MVQLVEFVESADMFFALGTILAGMFNTFPTTPFSQNIGLVGMTGVRSRWVTVTGGAIMVLLGLMPKLGALVAPQFFIHFPKVLEPMLHSGILLTAVVAFVLNLYFNGFGLLDAKGLRELESTAEDAASLR